MDDDDAREFSRGIVLGFFDQAESTFEKMETALYEQTLISLLPLSFFPHIGRLETPEH
jgi:osomolarity two-component system phosphorelay intermediate protein YPD1